MNVFKQRFLNISYQPRFELDSSSNIYIYSHCGAVFVLKRLIIV